MSVRENLMLAQMGQHRGFGRGFGKRADRVADLLRDLGLPADRLDQSLLNFSGGMQQKIIIARWLLTEPEILILDEPTKGVDIGTRSQVYRMLQDAADAGLAVIVISSDFEELLGICERIIVVSDGITIADLPADRLTEEKLTLLAAPRTSTARNQALLRDLAREHGGDAFWTLLDGDGIICLAQAGAELAGLVPGQAAEAQKTHIPAALTARDGVFVTEADGQRQTLLVQMTDRRGHDLGWIGLTLPGDVPPPPPDGIRMTDTIPTPRRPNPLGGIVRSLEFRMLGLALLLAIILSLSSPYFLTERNIFNILDQSVVIGIVAVGMTFVILTGGIDLSVGAVFGLTGIVLALALKAMPIVLAVPVAVAAGAGIGLFSGVLIAVFGLAPFVVTLGIMAIGRSLSFILSGQRSISGLPPDLDAIVYSTFLGIPANVLFLLALYLAAWGYLTYTKGGRTIYAIGSNVEAARAAGLSTLVYSILPYVVSGALASVAVTFSLAQVMSADPLAGNGLELDAIAAVVIGGASLYGGRGSIIGTLLGVLIMVMIRNGLNLMGVSPFWQGTAIGSIIIIALLAERLINMRSARG